jgi:hypothetical protein
MKTMVDLRPIETGSASLSSKDSTGSHQLPFTTPSRLTADSCPHTADHFSKTWPDINNFFQNVNSPDKTWGVLF